MLKWNHIILFKSLYLIRFQSWPLSEIIETIIIIIIISNANDQSVLHFWVFHLEVLKGDFNLEAYSHLGVLSVGESQGGRFIPKSYTETANRNNFINQISKWFKTIIYNNLHFRIRFSKLYLADVLLINWYMRSKLSLFSKIKIISHRCFMLFCCWIAR